MKKCAIFDLDGTLFNTNDVNYYAYKEALSKYNISMDYEYYCNYCNGRHYKVFIPDLVNNDINKIEDIHYNKKELYSKYLDKVKINNHLIEFIKSIKEKYYIALVTTASSKNTYDILNYTNTFKLFDLILTSDDVKNAKPNPEGFNKAIDYFKLNPSDCVIFEDSDVGIEAALKTGAEVIRIEKF